MKGVHFAPVVVLVCIFPGLALSQLFAFFCPSRDGTGACDTKSYSTSDPACFTPSGSVQSVKFLAEVGKGNETRFEGNYSLIYSSKPNCACQDFKQTLLYKDGQPPSELELDTSKPHAAFKWVKGKGGNNTC